LPQKQKSCHPEFLHFPVTFDLSFRVKLQQTTPPGTREKPEVSWFDVPNPYSKTLNSFNDQNPVTKRLTIYHLGFFWGWYILKKSETDVVITENIENRSLPG